MTNALYSWYWGKVHPFFFNDYETELKTKSKWLVYFVGFTFIMSILALGTSMYVYSRESKSLLLSYDDIVMIEDKAYIPIQFEHT